ncbi:hypothetical protein BGZ63DRAFT_367804 [Mariannaea sp. PMI_226]|nr:hypothetical protein BGZ63DRAFT_367804 [Mariannaea sp. PMI_226]
MQRKPSERAHRIRFIITIGILLRLWDSSLALTIQNPNAFRSSLLIAALHYTWNAGSLRSYESTFLFHKVDAMQLINEWLGSPSPKLVTTCIREICTLAFAECCLGDVQTADTHIDGLMRMMDLHRPITSVIQPKLGLEDELANRYFLLTYNFVHGVKSRIHDLVGNDFKSIPADIEDLMHKWHVEEKDGLETRLQSMRLFPSFFNVPPDGTNLQLVDGFPFVECLRKFTMMTTLRKQAEMNQGRSFGGRIDQIWLEGAATRLLLVLVGSHANSMYGKKNNTKTEKTPQGKLLVSWSGMTSTIGLYLNEVLGVWNAGQLLENRLHRRVLYILAGDLSRQDCTCEGGDDIVALNFGFWQAFTGALSIAKHRRHGAGSLPTAFESCFRSFIVRWIRKTGITRWDEAKSCLDSVVWPSEHMDEAVELEIWQEAVFEAQQ